MSQISGQRNETDREEWLARIPAFPPIVLRLLDLLARDDVEIRELLALISSDPAFAAQILTVANSPLFGFRARIDSLQSALVVLGLRRVRSLCMTVATANHIKGALCIEELSRCWRHMLACALITDELARACRAFEERAYTAGLLHDIGRLGLLLAYPNEYAGLLHGIAHSDREMLDREREAMGMDHCEAGRLLAAQWNLPQDFQVVAARHHHPLQDSALDLLALVHLGCALADSLGYWVIEPAEPCSPEQIRAALPPSLGKRIPIDARRWRESVERRIRCYADPDAAGLETYEPELEGDSEEPELPAADLAKLARLRLPDPNASNSFPREIFKLVGIGLLFTLLIVVLVFLAMKK